MERALPPLVAPNELLLEPFLAGLELKKLRLKDQSPEVSVVSNDQHIIEDWVEGRRTFLAYNWELTDEKSASVFKNRLTVPALLSDMTQNHVPEEVQKVRIGW